MNHIYKRNIDKSCFKKIYLPSAPMRLTGRSHYSVESNRVQWVHFTSKAEILKKSEFGKNQQKVPKAEKCSNFRNFPYFSEYPATLVPVQFYPSHRASVLCCYLNSCCYYYCWYYYYLLLLNTPVLLYLDLVLIKYR
jgi:hypothetical protein